MFIKFHVPKRVFRYLIAILIIVSLYFLNFTKRLNNYYHTVTDESVVVFPFNDEVRAPGISAKNIRTPRENAVFISVVRDSDLYDIMKSIRQIEDRFNHKFNYDWVFLNDQQFSFRFIETTSDLVSGNTYYGYIPLKDQWSIPKWVNKKRAKKVIKENKKRDKGDSMTRSHIHRYFSGFFFRHKLLANYDYFWKIEPGIEILCDVDYDIFKFMKDNNKEFGFSIATKNLFGDKESLWNVTKEFINKNPEYIEKENLLNWLTNNNNIDDFNYNGCQFFTNFEIGKLSFWNSQKYIDYFNYLDLNGGLYYERWDDARIHSLALSFLMPKEKFHFFDDIGYFHNPLYNCPADKDIFIEKKCRCDRSRDVTWTGGSCISSFYDITNRKKPEK